MTVIVAFVAGFGLGAIAMILSVVIYHSFYVRFVDKTADVAIDDRPIDGGDPRWNSRTPGKRR